MNSLALFICRQSHRTDEVDDNVFITTIDPEKVS
jgi:hypothetical protein